MKREVTVLLVLSVLLLAGIAAAQGEEEEFLAEEEIIPGESAGVTPDSPLYVFDKIVDNVQLSLAKGEGKTRKALEIKEERLAEATLMVDKEKPDAAKDALELATKAAEQAQKDLTPDLEKETNENVRRAARLLSGLQEKLPDEGWESVEKALNAQLSEEEKVRIALLVSKTRLSYCDAIAQQDFDLMKDDELCQLEKAPQWLKEKVEGEFKTREENARNLILDSVSQCIIDPKKCDCSQIPVGKHSQSCEEKKALAIRCEYENDDEACFALSSEKVEDFLPEFVGKEGKDTLLEHLRQKEEQMFERFKPPECEAAATFEDCFSIMKELYGSPPECEGLSDDECIELMKSKGPESEEERLGQMPPECQEAGISTPLECAELMFSKYGMPPQCEGLDTRECMKLMRHERPDSANFGMPPECQEAGAKEPRQCFDIMTAKYGFPPECKELSADDCFKEMMKRGPGEPGQEKRGQLPPECQEAGVTEHRQCFDIITAKYGYPPECSGKSNDECFELMMKRPPETPGARDREQEPPECKEKGLTGKDCFLAMMELHGTPRECEGISTDECFQKMTREGPKGGGGQCVGLSPEECRAKMQEQHGLPPECAENPDRCREAFGERGMPGGLPAECAGLEREQCELVMMQKFGPPECREVSTREDCETIMKEKYGSEGPGPGGPGEGGFGEEERRKFEGAGFGGGFKNECEGLSREECEQAMFEKFKPQECSGISKEECGRMMRERHEDGPREGQEGFRQGEPGRFPPECEGLSPEQCAETMRGKEGFEGEHREEGRETFRGVPPECQGLSEEDCRGKFFDNRGEGERMGEGERREIPPGGRENEGEHREFTSEETRPTERRMLGEPIRGEYPKPEGDYHRDYPQQPSAAQPIGGGDYPQHSEQAPPQSSSESYPSSGSSTSDDGSSSGSDRSNSGSSESGHQPAAEAITGQIVRAVRWIGGQE